MRDYLSDDTGDLKWDGGLVAGESTNDSVRKLLLINKGELAHAPFIGVAIDSYINDDRPGAMLSEIRRQIAADGGEVESISYKDGELEINANYED